MNGQERCLGLAQRRLQNFQDAAETRAINISCRRQQRTGAGAWRLSMEAATKSDKGRGSESKRKRRLAPFSALAERFRTWTLRLGPFDAHVASFWCARVQHSTLGEIFCTAETEIGGPLHRQQWTKGRPYARTRHQNEGRDPHSFLRTEQSKLETGRSCKVVSVAGVHKRVAALK